MSAELDGRFVKVDLTERECKAAHTLCEMAGAMLKDMGGQVRESDRQELMVSINSLRYKMSLASSLLNPAVIESPASLIAQDVRGIIRRK